MELLKNIIPAIENTNLKDIRIYETSSITPLFDYVVNATATSSRQLAAIVNNIKKESQEKGFDVRSVEGARGEIWVLVDLNSVLVNVFLGEEREKYALDRLWKDLPQVDYEALKEKRK